MIKLDNYYIEQNKNKIIITLPQTLNSVTNTVDPISFTRKEELTQDELSKILREVYSIFEGKDKL